MSDTRPLGRYTTPAIVFHWVIALLVFTNIGLAWSWHWVPDDSVRPLINNHKSIGITVLGLVVLRIVWRLTHRPPALPDHHKAWERGLAHFVHWALYAAIVIMPLSGWIMDSAYKDAATHPNFYFGLFQWPRIGWIMALDPATKKSVHDVFEAVHGLTADVIYALVFLHIAGALKHQVLDGEAELARMGVGSG